MQALQDRKAKLQWPPKNTRLLGAIFCGLLILSIAIGFTLGKMTQKPHAQDATAAKMDQAATPVPQAQPATAKLFVDPESNAAQQAGQWRASRPGDAAKMDKLAAIPTTKWVVSRQTLDSVAAYAKAAADKQAVVSLAIYYLPWRDCGSYSAGGAKKADDYRSFIRDLNSAIGTTKAIIIVEPDALAGIDGKNADGDPCLSDDQQGQYYSLLNYAADTLKGTGRQLYIDAGNSNWINDTGQMATRLRKAGVAKIDGFSLNVSNFRPTDETIKYGTAIAKALDDKHFVIDTSRNGLGAYTNPNKDGLNWCNPPGRALGAFPTLTPNKPLVDAYLYVKYPGESDGADADNAKCFGGPAAGEWWPEYALGLIDRWPAAMQTR